MAKWIYELFFFTSILSGLIPIGLILTKIKKCLQKFWLALLFLVVIAVFTDTICYFFSKHYIRTITIINVYTIVSSFIILLIFRLLAREKKVIKLIITILLPITVIVGFIQLYNIGNSFLMTEYHTIYAVFFLLLSLVIYHSLLQDELINEILKEPKFWIVSAFFFYYGFSFFVSLFENIIIEDDVKITLTLWPIQLLATIVQNVFFSIGIWKHLKR
ncbi:MAG: hypothetical protein EP305_04455 [Bacteroidetes bacterium]|nr:MAG: hypothetical protein EP305_04455 [Bacteroidota bacterium]